MESGTLTVRLNSNFSSTSPIHGLLHGNHHHGISNLTDQRWHRFQQCNNQSHQQIQEEMAAVKVGTSMTTRTCNTAVSIVSSSCLKPNTRNTMQHNLPSQSPVWLIVTSAAICHNRSNNGCHHCQRTMAIGNGSNTGSEHRIDHLQWPRCLLFYGIEGTDTNLRTTYYLNLQQYTPRTYHTPNETSVRVLVWIPLLTWI